jgi:hypothetical protein
MSGGQAELLARQMERAARDAMMTAVMLLLLLLRRLPDPPSILSARMRIGLDRSGHARLQRHRWGRSLDEFGFGPRNGSWGLPEPARPCSGIAAERERCQPHYRKVIMHRSAELCSAPSSPSGALPSLPSSPRRSPSPAHLVVEKESIAPTPVVPKSGLSWADAAKQRRSWNVKSRQPQQAASFRVEDFPTE